MRLWSLVPGALRPAMRPKHQLLMMMQMHLQPGMHATAIKTQIPLYRPVATGYEAESSVSDDDADAAPARHARDSYQDTDTALTARRDRL